MRNMSQMRALFLFLLFSISLFGETPKAVIFDFGGVVGKVDRKPILEYLSKSLDKPYKAVKKDFKGEALYIALEKPLTFWEEYAKASLPPHWKIDFESAKQKIVREIPGMHALITHIKKQGIQVALLSNTKENRARFIEKMGAYSHFDPILLSCYLGAKKPGFSAHRPPCSPLGPGNESR